MSPQSAPGPTSDDDTLWLDEDSDETDTTRPVAPPPWPAPPPWYGGGDGEPPRPRQPRTLTFAAVAVVAAAVGAAIAVGITHWPASSPSSAASAGPPAGSSPAGPAPNTGNGLQAPGLGGGSGVSEQLMLAGKVTAVSGTSITINAGTNTITAQITSATQFAGSVKTTSGIKTGDEVMIEVSVDNGKSVATTITDPFTGTGSLP
jgi:Domain of unknown function (DUF5666)